MRGVRRSEENETGLKIMGRGVAGLSKILSVVSVDAGCNSMQ